MITIEIENPAEVAANESVLARAFGGLLPRFVKRKVEEQVVVELMAVFEERGIRARIDIVQRPHSTAPRAMPEARDHRQGWSREPGRRR